MAVEAYQFDEPIGLYGTLSHERLAQGVVNDLIRYEEALEGVDAFELPYLGVELPVSEKFRISSLVESSDARDGYVLTTAHPDKETMGGTLYHVDRHGPDVLEAKAVAVSHPATFKGNKDYQAAVQRLVENFERNELEIITRMLVKMTVSIDKASELQAVDEDLLASLSVTGRMREDANINRSRSILQRNAAIEPFVLSALHNSHRIKRQNMLSEGKLDNERDEHQPVEHILDWEEFVLSVNDLLEQDEIQQLPGDNVNLSYEIGTKIYYVKLATNHGMLSGVQMLCDDLGAWKSQAFDLDSAEADHSGRNNLNDMWDRGEILACIKDAEIIDDEAYEHYRILAEESLRTRFAAKGEKPIQVEALQHKRPAA